MKVITKQSELKKNLDLYQGKTIGFVPTMGALHAGHLSLIKKAKEQSDTVIVSIFVNPLQFNEKEDFTKYPNRILEDQKKLNQEQVDFLYLPEVDEFYGKDFSTIISIEGEGRDVLCDKYRPRHFDGVITVMTKLLLQTGANKVFMGEKDFQQLFLIKKLVKDLNFDCEVISCETVRENDGLAMSSRNLNLSAENRKKAAEFFQMFSFLKDEIKNKQNNLQKVLDNTKKKILALGFKKIDYLEIRIEKNLKLLENYEDLEKEKKYRIFFAGYLNGVRLIDNILC